MIIRIQITFAEVFFMEYISTISFFIHVTDDKESNLSVGNVLEGFFAWGIVTRDHKDLVENTLERGKKKKIIDLTAWIFLLLKKQEVNKTWVCFEPVAQLEWYCLLNTWNHSCWSNGAPYSFFHSQPVKWPDRRGLNLLCSDLYLLSFHNSEVMEIIQKLFKLYTW